MGHIPTSLKGSWAPGSLKVMHIAKRDTEHPSLPIEVRGSECWGGLGWELLPLGSRARIPGEYGHLHCQLLPPRME